MNILKECAIDDDIIIMGYSVCVTLCRPYLSKQNWWKIKTHPFRVKTNNPPLKKKKKKKKKKKTELGLCVFFSWVFLGWVF